MSPAVQDRERDKFVETTAGETAVRTLIANDALSPVPVSGISATAVAPTGPFRVTSGTANDTAANPLASPLSNRVSASIRNLSATDTIYVGPAITVTPDNNVTTGGWEVGPGEDFHISLSAANAFYFVTQAGKTALWKILEIASTAGGGGGGSVTDAQESFAGPGTVFNLANTPSSDAAVKVFVNGVFQTQGTQYSISGTTITMGVALTAGQTLDVVYTY